LAQTFLSGVDPTLNGTVRTQKALQTPGGRTTTMIMIIVIIMMNKNGDVRWKSRHSLRNLPVQFAEGIIAGTALGSKAVLLRPP
jgi:hypothetical protein